DSIVCAGLYPGDDESLPCVLCVAATRASTPASPSDDQPTSEGSTQWYEASEPHAAIVDAAIRGARSTAKFGQIPPPRIVWRGGHSAPWRATDPPQVTARSRSRSPSSPEERGRP